MLSKILNKNGKIVITTPTVQSKNILNTLSYFILLDSTNIREHKHYWNKTDLEELAQNTGFELIKIRTFSI